MTRFPSLRPLYLERIAQSQDFWITSVRFFHFSTREKCFSRTCFSKKGRLALLEGSAGRNDVCRKVLCAQTMRGPQSGHCRKPFDRPPVVLHGPGRIGALLDSAKRLLQVIVVPPTPATESLGGAEAIGQRAKSIIQLVSVQQAGQFGSHFLESIVPDFAGHYLAE